MGKFDQGPTQPDKAPGQMPDQSKSVADRMGQIISSIPDRGPTPEITSAVENLRDSLFPPEYLSQLRDRGVKIEKVHYGMSKRKIEIILPIQAVNRERGIMIRYARGEPGYIRLITGVRDGERVLKEESLPETVDDAAARIQEIVEDLLSTA